MACGRAVVCTNVGGVAEAVGDAGIVVAAARLAAVAEACVELLATTTLRQRARPSTARAAGARPVHAAPSRWTPTATSTSDWPTRRSPPRRRRRPPSGAHAAGSRSTATSDGSPGAAVDDRGDVGRVSRRATRPGRRAPSSHGRCHGGVAADCHDGRGRGRRRSRSDRRRRTTRPRRGLRRPARRPGRPGPPRRPAAVDALQVAAALETDGVTDRVARVEYGYADVFDLADEVFRRAGPRRAPAARRSAPTAARRRRAPLREICRTALLYLLPGALFPAALARGRPALAAGRAGAGRRARLGVGRRRELARLPAASASATSRRPRRVLRLVDAGRPRRSPRSAWRRSSTTGGGVRRWSALAVGMMAYQMASTLLVFYRRELWLARARWPRPWPVGVALRRRPAVALRCWRWSRSAAVSVAALAFALVRRCAGPARADGVRDRRPARAAAAAGGAAARWVAAYSALAAAFLLHAQAPYLLSRLDVVLAVAPLIAGMGVVEWRAAPLRRAGAAAADPGAATRGEFARAGLAALLGRDSSCCWPRSARARDRRCWPGCATLGLLTPGRRRDGRRRTSRWPAPTSSASCWPDRTGTAGSARRSRRRSRRTSARRRSRRRRAADARSRTPSLFLGSAVLLRSSSWSAWRRCSARPGATGDQT